MSHNCAIAGAGCGKTTALVRAVQALMDKQVKSKEIMIMTFTRAAAAELMGRIGDKEMNIGTIDSLACQCISQNAPELLNHADCVALYKVAWLSFLRRTNCSKTKKYIKGIKYIFVDEYQDVMNVYEAILQVMSLNGAILYVIGDPAQSIYSFNGASGKYLRNFCELFQPCTRLFFNKNYRSTPDICAIASALLNHMNSDNCPCLQTDRQNSGICKLIRFDTPEEEIAFINKIAKSRHNSKALLTRTNINHATLNLKVDSNITVCTVHYAKGLEYDVVFIPQMSDEEFPYKTCLDIEEELRLFYVAVTRAKTFLYISYVGQQCSRFLAPIWHLLDKVGDPKRAHVIELPRKAHEISTIAAFAQQCKIETYIQLQNIPKSKWSYRYIYPPKSRKWHILFRILTLRYCRETQKKAAEFSELNENSLAEADACGIPRSQVKIIDDYDDLYYYQIREAYKRIRNTELSMIAVLPDALKLCLLIHHKSYDMDSIPLKAINKLDTHIGRYQRTKVPVVYLEYKGNIDVIRKDDTIVLLSYDEIPENIDYVKKIIAYIYSCLHKECKSIEYLNICQGWSYVIELPDDWARDIFLEEITKLFNGQTSLSALQLVDLFESRWKL